ncbi:MAG: hypothetical protein ABH873_00220 [Candidatus Firestonebacteria bacterium]
MPIQNPGDDGSEPTYVCPYFSPFIDPGFKGTWIRIISRGVEYQTALGTVDNPGGMILKDPGPTWYYLAPPQIMETINNIWEPWETIASRLAGRGIETVQMLKNIGGVIGAFGAGVFGGIGPGVKALTSMGRVNYKVDTPLVYTDTDRREWTLQFGLAANDLTNSFFMLQGLKRLKAVSLPVKDVSGDINLGIELPYVFKLKSIVEGNETGDLINTYWSALTSLQPTYMAPYDENGSPMRIELTATFKELSPLYADYHKTDPSIW